MGDRALVVVCGATGNQGGNVVDALLAAGKWRVRALVRAPARAQGLASRGVELSQGDLADRGSLDRAFSGAKAVFGVTQPWSADYRRANVAQEVAHGKTLVDACGAAGCTLVLSTVLLIDAKPTTIPHVDSKLEIEAYAFGSKTACVVLGPASFMDNIGMDFFPVRRGKVRGFVDAQSKVPLVACHDIGRAAAAVLDDVERHVGKRLNLVDGLYSGSDICETLGRIRGGERFRWSAPPRLLMRLFANEFYKMRMTFEHMGRPPYPPAYEQALRQTAALVPDRFSLEDFLRAKGFADKRLT